MSSIRIFLLLQLFDFFTMTSEKVFSKLRDSMIQNQIISRGIENPSIIEAMRSVPRHKFGKSILSLYLYLLRSFRFSHQSLLRRLSTSNWTWTNHVTAIHCCSYATSSSCQRRRQCLRDRNWVWICSCSDISNREECLFVRDHPRTWRNGEGNHRTSGIC